MTIKKSVEGIVVLLSSNIQRLPEGEYDEDLDTLNALEVARSVVGAWQEVLEELGLLDSG